ncbi:hypothetical protein ABFX02_11G008600 [Erythranthe guttata]
MRQIPYLGAGASSAKVGSAVYISPPAATSTSAALACVGTFQALVLVILVCTLICAVAFNAVIRYMCARRRQPRTPANRKADLGCATAEQEPEIPFFICSEGMELAECPICLSEFAIGERIRVLEKCSHGFHLQFSYFKYSKRKEKPNITITTSTI